MINRAFPRGARQATDPIRDWTAQASRGQGAEYFADASNNSKRTNLLPEQRRARPILAEPGEDASEHCWAIFPVTGLGGACIFVTGIWKRTDWSVSRVQVGDIGVEMFWVDRWLGVGRPRRNNTAFAGYWVAKSRTKVEKEFVGSPAGLRKI
jgi:hypothetical protein